MRALGPDYAFRLGWLSVLRSGGSGAFAVLAISLAMIVLGALLLLTWNGERLLARWSSAAEFSVYLRDDATSEERGAIEALIDQSGVGVAREYVSKVDALTHFRREFAELGVAGGELRRQSVSCVGRGEAEARGRSGRPRRCPCEDAWHRLPASRTSATTAIGWVALPARCGPCGQPGWPWRR